MQICLFIAFLQEQREASVRRLFLCVASETAYP